MAKTRKDHEFLVQQGAVKDEEKDQDILFPQVRRAVVSPSKIALTVSRSL